MKGFNLHFFFIIHIIYKKKIFLFMISLSKYVINEAIIQPSELGRKTDGMYGMLSDFMRKSIEDNANNKPMDKQQSYRPNK